MKTMIDALRSRGSAWLHACVAALLLASPLAASGQANPRNFDHARTGFPLAGIHAVQACESCHLNGVFRGTPRDCASCHTAGSPFAATNTVKPQKHVPSVVGCEVCHNSQTFSGRTKFSHSVVQGIVQCHNCHDGNGATGRTPQHIPVSAGQRCDDCHKSFFNWVPTFFKHTEVVVNNRCDVCHNGRFPPADPVDADHVPFQFVTSAAFPNCDTCHKGGFVDWTTVRVHSSVLLVRDCAICHSGAFPPAVGQPNTPSHQGASPNCEDCHRNTVNWGDVSVVGVLGKSRGPAQQLAAFGKAARGHIPLPGGAQCSNCHRSSKNMGVAVRMDHRAVSTMACQTCHNGNYTSQGTTGASAKPGNHIPVQTLLNGASMDCKECHVSAGVAWTTVRMNHNNSQGGAAGACKTCHQLGASFAGNMEKRALNHTGAKAGAADCSSSGCHRPLGRLGATYRAWN